MARPLFPLLAPLKFLDRDSANLLTLGDNMTFPQQRILEAVECAMTGGGEVRVVGGVREFTRPSPVRIIILKARQMGVSTLTEAIAFTTAMARPFTRSLIVSHDLDSSEHLLDMTRRYWETSWYARNGIYTPKHLAGNRLGWHENDSSMRITTAKNLAGGRSHTLHFIHASEAAFWEKAKELMKGLNQAMPRQPLTFQFIESTANGYGNWYKDTWDAAVAGDNAYLPLFYSWWQHTAYTADHIGLGHLAERPLVFDDDEERALARAFTRLGWDDRDIRSRLIWRRDILATECDGDIDTFHQEYPSTPEEAFINTGRNVFNPKHLNAAYEPSDGTRGTLFERRGRVEFVPDRDGKLTVYRKPRDVDWYMVGADAAKQAKGDFAVAHVLDRTTWEQVAEWRDDVDPVTFAEQIMLLGRYYNEAMLCPETNMSGGAVAEIVRSRYDNVYMHRSDHKVRGQFANQYGFNTTQQTKPEAIGNVKRALLDRFNNGVGVTIHSRVLYDEAKGYVLTDTGRYENNNQEGAEHDDTVMAWALAITATVHEADSDDRPDIDVVSRAVAKERGRGPRTENEQDLRRVAAHVDAGLAPVAIAERPTRAADPDPDSDDPDSDDADPDSDDDIVVRLPVTPHRSRRRAYDDDDEYAAYLESDDGSLYDDPW